jgi:hypothetical protein
MQDDLLSHCIQQAQNSAGKLNEHIILVHKNAYSHVAQSSDRWHR